MILIMSDTKIPPFCKKDGDSLLFDRDGEFQFYVPEEYFPRIAVTIGDTISLIGVINYAIFDKNGKHSGLKTFMLPTIFSTRPSEVTKVKQVSLIKGQAIGDYRILHYKKGDAIILKNPIQDVTNTENFFSLFLITAKFPTTIGYDKLHEFFEMTAELNGFKFGVTAQMFGVIMSEICRSKTDESVPFRLAKDSNMHNYNPISIKMVPKYVSPFASITSENWDDAVVNAIIEKPGKKSPMEPILMG